MREKTGLQKQISEIFGNRDDPASNRHLPSRDRTQDKGTPRPPDPSAREQAVPPENSPPAKAPPKRITQGAQPPEMLNGSNNVQMVKQRYRSAGKVKSEPKTKDRLKIAIALSLVSLLVFQLIRTYYPSSSNDILTNSDLGIQMQASIAKTPTIFWPVPELYPKDIRDPMEWTTEKMKTVNGRGVASTSEASGPIVRGILYSADKPRAIIGTQLVRAGDVVHGALIVKIGRKTVEFQMDGEKWSQEVESLPE